MPLRNLVTYSYREATNCHRNYTSGCSASRQLYKRILASPHFPKKKYKSLPTYLRYAVDTLPMISEEIMFETKQISYYPRVTFINTTQMNTDKPCYDEIVRAVGALPAKIRITLNHTPSNGESARALTSLWKKETVSVSKFLTKIFKLSPHQARDVAASISKSPYKIRIASTLKEWVENYESPNFGSCASARGPIYTKTKRWGSELYYYLPNLEGMALVDKDNKVLARCLAHNKDKTYAAIYGQHAHHKAALKTYLESKNYGALLRGYRLTKKVKIPALKYKTQYFLPFCKSDVVGRNSFSVTYSKLDKEFTLHPPSSTNNTTIHSYNYGYGFVPSSQIAQKKVTRLAA